METKKKKNGGYYLKEKIAKLEAEKAELEEGAKKDAKEYNAKLREYEALEKKYKELKESVESKDASYVRLKNELNKTIEQQGKEIVRLTTEKENAKTERKFYADLAKKYWDAMGFIRQWFYARYKM